jgi:hypothetical protein
MRKRLDMQLRHLGDNTYLASAAPDFDNIVELDAAKVGGLMGLTYTVECFAFIEKQVQRHLLKYAEDSRVGQWMLSQIGIGPVIAAACLAYLDIGKAPTAGHFWSFCGLNPAQVWEKGQKRPYCADMKQAMFHLGECAKRSSGHADAVYGKLYRDKKNKLVERNANGEFEDRARDHFELKSTDGPARKKLDAGQLPDFNLDRQAANYAAKIFLSHLHAVWYWDHFKRIPPRPFAVQHLGHAHEIRVPNTETLFPGFAEAYYGAPLAKAA